MRRCFSRSMTARLAGVGLAVLAGTAPALAQEGAITRRGLIALIDAGRGGYALQLADVPNSDPVFRQYIEWLALVRGQSGENLPFDQYRAFLRQRSHWPAQSTLRRRAEQALLSESGGRTADEIRAWFKDNPPLSADARIWLAGDHLAAGRSRDAQTVIRDLWVGDTLSARDETDILGRFGTLLTLADHRDRVDALLWRGQVEAARRGLSWLAPPDRLAAEARIKLAANARDADAALAAVPAATRDQPGLLLERIKRARAANDNATARALLLGAPAPVEPQKIDQWWKERDRQIRRALDEGDLAIAYRLARDHRLPPHSAEAGEAEFIAGWLALRRFNRPGDAMKHFEVLIDPVRHGTARARGHFWLARAAEADGSRREAARHDAKAAEWVTSFYGQLSLARLKGAEARLPADPRPASAEDRAFTTGDVAAVVRLLASMGEQTRLEPFIARLSESQAGVSPAQFAQAGALALSIGRPDLGIWVGRRALRDGVILIDAAFPDSPWPLDPGTLEPAFTTAIMRQESSFRGDTTSPAGARGLMQCMPAMAKETTKLLGLPYNRDRLLTDPAYNLIIGQTYLSGVLARFDGAYILAAAGYNAGPARAAQWVASYGDPRTDIDPLDWIERIPFEETRNYVQRVMEATNVYRLKSARGPQIATADIRALGAGAWCALGCPPERAQYVSIQNRPAASSGPVDIPLSEGN